VVSGLITSTFIFSIVLNIYLVMMVASMFAGPSESTYAEGDRRRRIVIVPINGAIGDQTAKFVHAALKRLRDDPPKAVILRVDSPGGGVAASDRIWHELVQFKQETQIPLVASFGASATSGGYYISAPADHILAEPTTVTGSIGVIAQAFTLQELLHKVGITPEIVAATAATKKDRLNPMREWTDEDRAVLRKILDDAYERFVDVVAQGRQGRLTAEEVRALATGEVYTCAQAISNKLVDEQGYLDAAIAKAKELAGIPADVTPMVTTMAPSESLGWLGLLRGPGQDLDAVSGRQLRQWLQELMVPRIEYLHVR
jgi:protease-4